MFLIRPKTHPNESILSYLVRASHVNGLKSPLQIFQAIRLPITNSRIPNDKVLYGEYAQKALFGAFNLTDTEFPVLFAHQSDGLNLIGDFTVPSTIFRTNHPRICPYCVQEMGFIECSTFFLPKTYCTKHQTALVDRLDGKRIRWSTPFLFKSLLEYKRSNESHSNTSGTVIDFNNILEKLISHEPSTLMPVQFRNMNLDEISKLIDFSMRYKNRTNASTPLNLANFTNDQLAKAFEDVHSFLMNWPISLDNLLFYYEKNPMSNRRGKHGIRYCFRDLYDELYAKQNEHHLAYSLLKQQFENYLATQYSDSAFLSTISRISTNLYENSRLINRKHAAKILKCRANKVDIYVREGLLQKSGHEGSLFLRKDVELLSHRLSNCLTLNQLASKLEIGRYKTISLLNDKIIKPILSPNENNRDWLIEKDEVLRFISILHSNSSFTTPNNATASTFKKITFHGMNFSCVIRKMLNGEITYLYVSCTDITKSLSLNQFIPFLRHEVDDLDFFTPKEASKYLSVNVNAIYFWIKKGLLKATKKKVNNVTRPIIMIDITDAYEFKSKYILSKNRVYNKKYTAISGPQIDGGIVNLFIE